MFLSVMLWFILNDSKETAVIIDGDRVYVVSQVINSEVSSTNIDCENEEPETFSSRRSSTISTGRSEVSKLMIAQFFTEVEGPDRNWIDEDYGLLWEDGEH